MTYKQIEASRETRLWLTQVILPAAGIAVVALSNPEVRYSVGKKIDETKQYIRDKFKKN